MKEALLLTFAYLFYCEGIAVVNRPCPRVEPSCENERPIIGVLTQELSSYLRSKYPGECYSGYIAASYVKSVEAAGARVVPILIGKDRSYYETLLRKINGVLLPGGASDLTRSGGYAEAGHHIYAIAKQMNDCGDYFPLFGTCLGFELLLILASGLRCGENRITCTSQCPRSLQFTHDFRQSKMFSEVPEDVVSVLDREDVTVNHHHFCITDEYLASHNLTCDWRVTSHSDDDHGLRFISSIENKRYPFYGIQFHSEKSAFEWKATKYYPHSINAIRSNRYFMDFFVKESRKNRHAFSSQEEENQYLIYKCAPRFTGLVGSAYQQCYFFESLSNNDQWKCIH